MAKWITKDPNRESTIEFKLFPEKSVRWLPKKQTHSVASMLSQIGALERVYRKPLGRFIPMLSIVLATLTALGFLVIVGLSFLRAP